MSKRSPHRSTARAAVLGLAALLAVPDDAGAYKVYNETRYPVIASVVDADDFQEVEIAPGGMVECKWREDDCSLYVPESPDILDRIQIKAPPIEHGQFECWIGLRLGGVAYIREQDRSHLDPDMPPNLYCLSLYNRGGGFESVDWSDPFTQDFGPSELESMLPENRDVHFLVTADPQYSYHEADEPENQNADDVMSAMLQLVSAGLEGTANAPYYRGITVAGDLVHSNLDDGDEWERYRSNFNLFEGGDDYHHFSFEGLGNHDLPHFDKGSNPGWRDCCYGEEDLYVYISDKLRNTRLTKEQEPHFSWDWHDVHFAQLNLYPGEGPLRRTDHPHFDGLAFLRNDLAQYVGPDSGRPVVLIHHYGFDGLSTGLNDDGEPAWWTEEEREAYWNVIKGYNVVAIFTGHWHLSAAIARSGWVRPFVKPSGAEDRPDGRRTIPAFVAGAARGYDGAKGVFLSVEINSDDQMIVRRLSPDSAGHAQPVIGANGDPQVQTVCVGPRCPGAQCIAPFERSAGTQCEARVLATDVYDGTIPDSLSCAFNVSGALVHPFTVAGVGEHALDLDCENDTSASGETTPWNFHASSCSTKLTLKDDAPPHALACTVPGEAQQCGAPVAFTVSAADNCTAAGDLATTCVDGATGQSVSPGDALFTVGTTNLDCEAVDESNNTASCKIAVQAVDTEGPVIELVGSADNKVQCAIEEYTERGATAEDLCEGSIPSDHIEVQGTVNWQRIGRYLVTYSVEDSRDNKTRIGRLVEVVDTVPPKITLSRREAYYLECGAESFEPTDAHGPKSEDACDPSPKILVNGSVDAYALNEYLLQYTAQDASGNVSGEEAGIVIVRDTIAPTLTGCPADLVVEPTGPSGTVVTYEAPSATDACDPTPTMVCTIASGSTFGIGTTEVACTAADDVANKSSCSFTVTVLSDEGMVAKLADGADDLLAAGSLNGGQARGLDQQLDVIMAQVQAGDTGSACGQLAGFISHVNDLIAEGVLTAAEGEPLIATANNLRATLGCGRQTAAG